MLFQNFHVFLRTVNPLGFVGLRVFLCYTYICINTGLYTYSYILKGYLAEYRLAFLLPYWFSDFPRAACHIYSAL